jgi:hypothetical protein
MTTIEWKEQDEFYGLDYSTKTGKWHDYRFDIRYDYVGARGVKPSNDCSIILSVFKGFKSELPIHVNYGHSIDALTEYANAYLISEQEKFRNASFSPMEDKLSNKS